MGQRPSRRRRSIRLAGFDYRQPGAYFVTICTRQRESILADILDEGLFLSPLGRVVLRCWRQIPAHFPHVGLDVHVIMPDHIHGILRMNRRGTPWRAPTPREAFGGPVSGSLPTVIRSFKSAVGILAAGQRLCSGRVWQRGDYERVIRGQKELDRLREYVVQNPMAKSFQQEPPI